ncbi:hypothetical protein HPB48_006045 [Haemaphysalis longicornis]|uniref:Uncharacterized protein n=1 Tax=Haemaphysalis longicornis TaxID=44386 RepID=A0A9J6FN33_HAELO|nr:hypothetical protein HPB48_006045 [Haemaphysalis longicornis]
MPELLQHLQLIPGGKCGEFKTCQSKNHSASSPKGVTHRRVKKEPVRPVPLPGKSARQPFFISLHFSQERARDTGLWYTRNTGEERTLGMSLVEEGRPEAGQACAGNTSRLGRAWSTDILTPRGRRLKCTVKRVGKEFVVPASPLSSSCPARLRGLQRRANRYNRWALVRRVWCAQQSSGDGADNNAYTDDGCGVCFHDGHRKGNERKNKENTSTHRQRTPRRGKTTATHALQRTPQAVRRNHTVGPLSASRDKDL